MPICGTSSPVAVVGRVEPADDVDVLLDLLEGGPQVVGQQHAGKVLGSRRGVVEPIDRQERWQVHVFVCWLHL